MKLSTLELYEYSKCGRRFFQTSLPKTVTFSPAREVIKRIFLSQGIGRHTNWRIDNVAALWDSLFWKGRDITRENIDRSVKGVLAMKALYKRLPQTGFQSYPPKMFESSIDSSLIISSSADFILSYNDRIESWIHLDSTPKQIRRSVLPQLEHVLVQRKLRTLAPKEFCLVIYHTTIDKMRPTFFRIKSESKEEDNTDLLISLSDSIKKEIQTVREGPACDNCIINC